MFSQAQFRGDLFGGVTAAVVALPLALAFGVASGAGALAGLYGAVLTGFFAAVFGGTRVQISGPTGPMTVVMALVITQFEGDLAAAFAVVCLAGLFQVLLGRLGVGRYIKLVPQPVVSGFMSGIGVIIIILQCGPLVGATLPEGDIAVKLAAIPTLLARPQAAATCLALLSLATVFLLPERINRYLPSPLLAIVLGSTAAWLWFPAAPVIGELPGGLPSLQLPRLSLADLQDVLRFALVLAFLGAIDSLLTSLVADSITRTHHDSNRELVGQGIGNLVAGLFGGLPGAGATMRTLVNVRAGGTTRLSGVIHALLLAGVALGFGDVAGRIPLAVLAGILVKVGVDIIDWRYLRRVHRAPRAGVVIMFITLGLTVFVDLIAAVAVGVVMASVLFVARMADAQMRTARFAFGADQIDDPSPEEQALLAAADGRIVLFHIEGPLSFGSARDVARIMQNDIDKDVLAIDCRDVPFIDSSAAAALEEVILRLRDIGDTVILFGARDEVVRTLDQAGVLEQLGSTRLVATRHQALLLAADIIGIARTEAGAAAGGD